MTKTTFIYFIPGKYSIITGYNKKNRLKHIFIYVSFKILIILSKKSHNLLKQRVTADS